MNRLVKKKVLIPALWMAFLTLCSGLVLSLGLESVVKTTQSILLSLVLLVVVIALGVVSDAIGTAAAAADITPFNALAAKKTRGARQAVSIVQNASVVASFLADVIGDISGTVSGALGASIVLQITNEMTIYNTVLLGATMTSLIAALMVGGKSIGKNIAIQHANAIVFKVALVIQYWERLTGKQLFNRRR